MNDYIVLTQLESDQIRVNFSLRKEVFFVIIGSFVGAFTMHFQPIILDLFGYTSYYITLLVAASVVGSKLAIVGFLLHLFVATIIGIITGVFLHRVIKFDISRFRNGIIYGLIASVIVFAVFAIPVSQLLLDVNTAQIMSDLDPNMTFDDASTLIQESLFLNLLNSLLLHTIWGLTLGIISSLLTRKIGANYRCYRCDIEFTNTKTYQKHLLHVHQSPSDTMQKILILGGGYAGINILKKVQSYFESNTNISIELVNDSNFFLHTPMLPEMATGTIEPRHIATPIRNFCKRARFYQGTVTEIDINSKKVLIKRDLDNQEKILPYDYLVIALGNKTNFFNNKNIEQHSITIKSLDDAIQIRNHIIAILEGADQEADPNIQSKLTTFVVVGGGFSGVETAGEINEFIRDSCKKFYRNIDPKSIRVILIASGDSILPEIGKLGSYAKESLTKAGVEIITNTKLVDATKDTAVLNDKRIINCSTLIWAGGNKVDDVILQIDAQRDKRGRLLTDKYLRLKDHPNIFALGDCALVVDPKTQQAYPPTAQHAIRQAYVAAANLIHSIKSTDKSSLSSLESFTYTTKGSMAKIGKKDGVALLLGREFRGFSAWFIWKQYYLSTLPTMEKRIRVGIDWFIDLFFPRDITRLD